MAGICRTLFSVWPSKQIRERGCSDFLFSPHLLGLAFSLSRKGDARLVLSSYSTPTDLEPLAAVWEPKKGSGENDPKRNQSGGEGRFSSLKRKMNSPRIVQVKIMCRMHHAPWCSSNKGKWNDFPMRTVQLDWCVMLALSSHLVGMCDYSGYYFSFLNFFSLSSPAWIRKYPWSPTAVFLFAFVSLWDLCLCPALSCTLSSLL